MNRHNHTISLIVVLGSCIVPVVAQDIGDIRSPLRRPTLATWKINSAKVGVQKDGATWTTTLWLIAPRPVPQSGPRAPRRASLTFLDRSLKPIAISAQLPGAEVRVVSQITVTLPANADRGIVLSGAHSAFPATLFTVKIEAPAGYLVFALPEHRDKAGLPSQVFDETGSTSGTVEAREFGAAFDIAEGRDMQLIMYNPRAGDLPVLVEAYDTAANDPFAAISLTLPGQAPGNVGSYSWRMLSDLFGTNPEFAARRASGRAQGVLRFSAADTFAVNAGRIDVVRENGTTILSLAMQGVKTADATGVVQ